MRVAKAVKPKTVKNVITDALGKTVGRVHLGTQDFSKIALKKMKGLRKRPAGASPAEDGEDASDAGVEADATEAAAPRKRGRADL